MSPAGPRAMVLWGYFTATSLIWGSSFLFTTVSLREVPTFSLVTYRIALGAIVLILWNLARRQALRLGGRDAIAVGVVGLFNVAGSFSLITAAQETLSSAHTSVLVSALPIVSATLAALVLPGETFTRRRVSGLVIGFTGVIVILSRSLTASGPQDARSPAVASLLVLGGIVMIAAAAVYVKLRLQHLTAAQLIVPQLVVSIPVVGSIALLTESDSSVTLPLPQSLEAWSAVVWLGVFGAGVANICFYRLIAGWGVARTTLISYAIPVIGVFLGVVVLSEPLGGHVVIGTSLILASIVLISERRRGGTP